jgi:hypothetical protein
VNLLERFGGYTYSSLMKEDAEFLRLVKMVDEEREAMGSGE